ncbi:MAG: hypothetical protein OEM97_09355, partial [Acidimicrobiia bacterium]|nr:hypothetical protein [Acidimicrobiia bacterium]
ADPTAGVTDGIRSLALEQTVASHEALIWKRLLPIRGLLYQPDAWFKMVGQAGPSNCNPGYPYNTGYNNEDILNRYAIWAEGAPEGETWGSPIVTTHLYSPYYNWYASGLFCLYKDVFRPFISAWTLGLANDDAAAVTPATGLDRLFDPWDPNEPVTSGFGLSPQEVACEWIEADARGYMGRHEFYFNPCHAAFYDVADQAVSPYQAEDSHYLSALPWAAAYWRPSAAQLADGRSVTDPHVVSPSVPQLTFDSCDAFTAGNVRSIPGGADVKVYFTNLYDGDIDVYWIEKDGSTIFGFTLDRQDQLSRPLTGDPANGQFKLDYSDLVNTTAGTSFLVRDAADDRCLGSWTAEELPNKPAVGYAVAEVHGDNGILLAPAP